MPKAGEIKPVDLAPGARLRNQKALIEAAELIRAGALVAFPTETVYGLGADATNDRAVAGIFQAKGRPRFNPLIVHVAGVEAAAREAVLTDDALALAQAFWPGPLTIVAPRRTGSQVSELASAGLDTLALRAPDHPVAQALLKASGRPIAAPSANRSGHISATRADHVADDLGDRVALILDAGPTRIGIESTVVSCIGSTPTLLRAGAIDGDAIEAAIQRRLPRYMNNPVDPRSPGQLGSHYAPRASLRLDAIDLVAGEALLAFGAVDPPEGVRAINISPTGDLVEAAANLFAALRTLDASGVQRIAVSPIPDSGLGEAINDRLQRAAAPRA